jgi:hypothetical protein
MSKSKKRIKKALLAGAALFGASKLGMLGKTAQGIAGDKMASAKKLMTSDRAYSPKKFMESQIGKAKSGITELKRSDLPSKRNMKSIFVQDDGSIIKGTTKYADKKVYSDAMKKARGESESGFKDFLNKAILGPKTQLKKGKMVKARGGGMAIQGMKPTKLY